MKKSRCIVALLVLVLALGLLSVFAVSCAKDTTPITGPVELKFSTSVGVKYSLWGSYLKPWYEAVEESSDGLIDITAYPDNTLVKESQQYDALIDGLSDISVIVVDYNPGTFPAAEVGELPMLFPSAGVASDVLYDIITEYCQEDFKDVKALGPVLVSAAQYAGTVPVRLPADFEGLRIRTGAAIETDIINALGATPVEIQTGDLAVSMERNMADGGFLSYAFMSTTSAREWATDFVECELFYRFFVLAVNKDKWERFSPELQQAFLENTTKEKCRLYNLANDALAIPAGQTYKNLGAEEGNSFYKLNVHQREIWQEAMKQVWDKWVDNLPSDIDGQAILDRIEELTPAAEEAIASTVTTEAFQIRIVFTDLGNDTVEVMIEPMPGSLFNVSTEGGFASTIEAFDADGNSLGFLDLPDSADGVLDYSGVEGIAKLIATDVPHGGTEWEYIIP